MYYHILIFIAGVNQACFGAGTDICFATNSVIQNVFASLGFALSGQICTRDKLIAAQFFVVLATVCYIIIEVLLKKGKWLPETPKAVEEGDETKSQETIKTRF